MTTKRLGVLGIWIVFAISPVVAQVDSRQTSPSATAITPRYSGPMILNGLTPGGGVTSANWSGYAVTGSDFTYANGSWHVPQVSCSVTPNTYSAFWVGIDGFSDTTVEQIGTESDCNGTTPVYYAWYEFYPANPTEVVISNLPVSPGDKMGASVHYNTDGTFTLHLHDFTTGGNFEITKSAPGANRTSAEWIAEAPGCGPGCVLPLADFVRANYGKDYNVLDPDSCNATDSSVTDGEIVDFGAKVQKITMMKSVVEAAPTALTPDGASFRDYWKAE
jgi:hypothetical protein